MQQQLEDHFLSLWPTKALPLQREVLLRDLVQFVPGYQPDYRVDFYCASKKLVIEINGATGKGRAGAHSSFSGLKRDYTKQMFLTLAGYKIIELNSKMAKDKQLIDGIVEVLQQTKQAKTLFDASKMPSLSNVQKLARYEALTHLSLQEYTKRKTELPSTKQIFLSIKKKRSSCRLAYIKPWLLAQGWKQTSKGWVFS